MTMSKTAELLASEEFYDWKNVVTIGTNNNNSSSSRNNRRDARLAIMMLKNFKISDDFYDAIVSSGFDPKITKRCNAASKLTYSGPHCQYEAKLGVLCWL